MNVLRLLALTFCTDSRRRRWLWHLFLRPRCNSHRISLELRSLETVGCYLHKIFSRSRNCNADSGDSISSGTPTVLILAVHLKPGQQERTSEMNLSESLHNLRYSKLTRIKLNWLWREIKVYLSLLATCLPRVTSIFSVKYETNLVRGTIFRQLKICQICRRFCRCERRWLITLLGWDIGNAEVFWTRRSIVIRT